MSDDYGLRCQMNKAERDMQDVLSTTFGRPTLSEITQRYIREVDAGAWGRFLEAQRFMALLEKNAAGAPEIPVTVAMLVAGEKAALQDAGPMLLLAKVYRAMAKVAPDRVKFNSDQITWFNNTVALLPERDREIVRLRAERDAWKKLHDDLKSHLVRRQAIHTLFTGDTSTPDLPDPAASS